MCGMVTRRAAARKRQKEGKCLLLTVRGDVRESAKVQRWMGGKLLLSTVDGGPRQFAASLRGVWLMSLECCGVEDGCAWS